MATEKEFLTGGIIEDESDVIELISAKFGAHVAITLLENTLSDETTAEQLMAGNTTVEDIFGEQPDFLFVDANLNQGDTDGTFGARIVEWLCTTHPHILLIGISAQPKNPVNCHAYIPKPDITDFRQTEQHVEQILQTWENLR